MNEQLKVIISAEISKLKKGIADAKKEMGDFKSQVKKAKADVDKNFKAIGNSIDNGLKTAAKAGATAIAGIGAALVGTAAATEEYRQNQALLKSAFESAGGSAAAASETFNDLYRVLGDGGQATEAAQHLAKLTTEEKALNEWTNICQGVYSEFGSSLPLEGLTEAVNHTSKLGEVQGVLADALEWSGMNVETFNEELAKCNTEAEREALIRETLSDIYAESAATYEANNAQILAQRDAQAKLQESLAKIGEAVAPVITAFTSLASDALAKVTPHVQAFAEKYAPMIQPALEKAAEVTGKIVGFIVDNWGIIASVAGVIGGIAAAIGLYNAVAAIKAALAAAEVASVWGLVSAYAAQAVAMAAAIAPYVLIVAAIAAVIAIIVVCVKHWDEIKAKVSEVWDNIKNKTKAAVDSVVKFFGNLKDKAVEKVNALKQNTVNKFNEIKTGITDRVNQAKTTVLNVFENIKSGISKKINAARDAVKGAIDKIKSFFNFDFKLKIKIPTISISWSQSPKWMAEAAKVLGLQGVPKFSIKWNKLGGVFDKPTLFNYGGSLQGIGEDGAEAVVPLEKNTEWLDKIADMLSKKINVSVEAVMNVEGKTFATTCFNTMNSYGAQVGDIPLSIRL